MLAAVAKPETLMATRTETDSLGAVEVAAERGVRIPMTEGP